MAGEKKRQGRRAHLNDFYRDVAGNYVYTGTCYVCRAADGERAALLRRLWLLTAVMAAAVVAGGCISAPGMSRCFYVLLPYAAEVGLTGSVVWAMTRWQAREYPMREYVYKATVRALPGRCLGGGRSGRGGHHRRDGVPDFVRQRWTRRHGGGVPAAEGRIPCGSAVCAVSGAAKRLGARRQKRRNGDRIRKKTVQVPRQYGIMHKMAVHAGDGRGRPKREYSLFLHAMRAETQLCATGKHPLKQIKTKRS